MSVKTAAPIESGRVARKTQADGATGPNRSSLWRASRIPRDGSVSKGPFERRARPAAATASAGHGLLVPVSIASPRQRAVPASVPRNGRAGDPSTPGQPLAKVSYAPRARPTAALPSTGRNSLSKRGLETRRGKSASVCYEQMAEEDPNKGVRCRNEQCRSCAS